MSVSVREIHRLTAQAVQRHQELHAHHKRVAHGVAAERQAQAAAAAGQQRSPLSGTGAGREGASPPGVIHG